MLLNQNDFGLRPQDPFNVIQPVKLSESQLEILNRLFTPLIGTQAIGVYHYLSQFSHSKNQSNSHYVIMSELKLNLGDFRDEMSKLEAIGLIKTFVKHDEHVSHFVYELIQPPTAKKFFNDPMLSVYLYKEVDRTRFHELKSYFESNQFNLSNYQEITRNFTDVFKVPNQVMEENLTNQLQEPTIYDGINVSGAQFDFELLYQLLQNHYVSAEMIKHETKQLITQLAVLYGITPEGMKGLILKSLTSDQKIAHEELRKHARSFYAIEHENQLPALEVKKTSTINHSNEEATVELSTAPKTKDEFTSWFKMMDTTSPIDMLASWSKSEPTLKQKYLVEDLITREQLPFGVINMLLQYVMLKNDMQLPKTYIQEIASNWKKKELQSAEEAYHHVKAMKKAEKERKQKQQSYQASPSYRNYGRKNTVSKEITPDWLLNGQHEKRRKKGEKRKIDTHDEQFLKDRAAFLKQLNETGEED